jgi:hypothetical protein
MTQSSRTLSSKGFFLFVVMFLILTKPAINDVVNKDFFDLKGNLHSLEGYQVEFTRKNKIYSNGGSEIYR